MKVIVNLMPETVMRLRAACAAMGVSTDQIVEEIVAERIQPAATILAAVARAAAEAEDLL